MFGVLDKDVDKFRGNPPHMLRYLLIHMLSAHGSFSYTQRMILYKPLNKTKITPDLEVFFNL